MVPVQHNPYIITTRRSIRLTATGSSFSAAAAAAAATGARGGGDCSEQRERDKTRHSLTSDQTLIYFPPSKANTYMHTCKQDFIKSICNSSLHIYALEQVHRVKISFDLSLCLRSAMMADWPLVWLLPLFPPLLWLPPFLRLR